MTARSREPRAELAKVASRARSRVREQHRLHPLAAEPFDQACRFRRDGIPVTWATNGRLFLIDVTAPSGIVLAAGRPDEILGASQPVGVAAGTVIFRCAAFSPTGWLSQLEHSSLIAALGLSANEQLLVARSGATLLVEPRGLEADWNRLGDLLRLVAALPPDDPPAGKGERIDGLRFDAAEVAPELQQLLSMLRTWATGDDAERSDRIASATEDDLRELNAEVSPELQRIDALIDSQEEPLSDEAVLLSRLAEAALEAR